MSLEHKPPGPEVWSSILLLFSFSATQPQHQHSLNADLLLLVTPRDSDSRHPIITSSERNELALAIFKACSFRYLWSYLDTVLARSVQHNRHGDGSVISCYAEVAAHLHFARDQSLL